jgi:hypothetical protein
MEVMVGASLRNVLRAFFRRKPHGGGPKPKTEAEKARELELLIQSGFVGKDTPPW